MPFVSIQLQILVIFCGQNAVKVNSVRSIASQIVNRDTLTGLILIVQNQVTNQALKAVNLLPFKVEIFQVCFPDLCYIFSTLVHFDLLENVFHFFMLFDARIINYIQLTKSSHEDSICSLTVCVIVGTYCSISMILCDNCLLVNIAYRRSSVKLEPSGSALL